MFSYVRLNTRQMYDVRTVTSHSPTSPTTIMLLSWSFGELVLPRITNICFYINVVKHIFVSKYIHIKIGINSLREYMFCISVCTGNWSIADPLDMLIFMCE
jgi:hypothetical protein